MEQETIQEPVNIFTLLARKATKTISPKEYNDSLNRLRLSDGGEYWTYY